MENQPLQRCENCLKEFPQSKSATHFGYCRRNIKRCPICNEMFDINFKQEHDEQYHKQENCPHCKLSFPSSDYKAHQTKCDQKPKYCQYCDLNVPVNTYPSHLKACESRTKPCTKCNIPITNKEYYFHIVSCEGPKEEPRHNNSYKQYLAQHQPLQPQQFQQPFQQKSYQQPQQQSYLRPQQQPSQPPQQLPQQQRRVFEQNPNNIGRNSRQKQNQPVYQPKIRQEKQYAPITQDRRQPKFVSYGPQPRQQIKPQQRRQLIRGPNPPPRIDPKKEDLRRYPNPINPPVPTIPAYGSLQKKQQIRGNGKISNQKDYNPANYNGKIDMGQRALNGNREGSRQNGKQPVSNKDLFPNQNYSRGGVVKESKSNQRFNILPRREEKPSNGIQVPSNNPAKSKALEPQNRIIYPSQPVVQPPQEETPNHHYHADYNNSNVGYGTEDDHELQMAIMQSLGQPGKKEGKSGADYHSYSFEGEVNQSFIQQQRAIEEDLKHKKRR